MTHLPASAVEIRLNGDRRTLPATTTLEALIRQLGSDPLAVAVELNAVILPRSSYASTVLQGGDAIEIVRFVQGG